MFVRRLWLAAALGVALGSGPRTADAGPRPDPDAVDHDDFWAMVARPYEDEIAAMVERAVQLLEGARNTREFPGTGRLRSASLRQAAGLVERIRGLAPTTPILAYLRGVIAEEGGRTAIAEQQLGRFVAAVEASARRTDALLRLGRIALTRRDGVAAIGPLREAVAEATSRPERTAAVLLLAAAFDQAGDLDRAIALLDSAIDRGLGPTETEDTTVWLALITAYDRDEQLSAALDLVERLRRVLEDDYLVRIWGALHQHAPLTLAEIWYQRALLLETAAALPAARAAWATYLGLGPDVRYRARAQAHLDAVDAELASRRGPVAPERGRLRGRP